MRVLPLPADRAEDATRVLGAAFHDYPVMRFVFGDSADYDRRLATLVGLFVSARVLRGEPMFGIADPAGRYPVAEAHHHLNMIGVRPDAQGQGHGRRLLESVHALAAADPASAGVSLTTEVEANVALAAEGSDAVHPSVGKR